MYFFFFLGQSPRIAISRRGDFSKKISRCRVVEKFLPPARRVTHFLKCSLAIMQKGMAESPFMEVGRYKFRLTARRIRPIFFAERKVTSQKVFRKSIGLIRNAQVQDVALGEKFVPS